MTYSDWRVELSEKYKVFKGLYKIIKTPGVIKAAPKQKLKNTVGISYKNSMGTLDYRRSIYPDYKANRRNRFARIKATPSGDPMADISQNIYKKEGKRSLERRLAAKEKIRQEWLKSNNLPPDSKAQPPGFNEGVASLAVKGGSKLIPLLMTSIGAAGTIMQARKKRKLGAAEKRLHDREMNVRDNDMIRARRGEADKQNKLIDKYEKKNKSQKEKNIRKNMIKGLKGGEVIQDEFSAPTNSMGGGAIAGSVEAGDNPPVKKKKRYIYGGRGSRKMWMNNK